MMHPPSGPDDSKSTTDKEAVCDGCDWLIKSTEEQQEVKTGVTGVTDNAEVQDEDEDVAADLDDPFAMTGQHGW